MRTVKYNHFPNKQLYSTSNLNIGIHTMLYDKVHKAMVAFEDGSCEQIFIESEDYSLYLNECNDKIFATLWLGSFKIELNEIGSMCQSYVTVADNLKTTLQSLSDNLTYLQTDLSC